MKRLRPTTKFHEIMLLIVFAIVVYSLFNNLSIISSAFWFLTDLFQPLIIGAILAFFLNVPMRGLEQLFQRIQLKHKKKVRERLNSTVSLIITYVGSFLLLLMVLYILIPQLVESVPGIIASIEAAMPRFYRFLESHGIDSSQIQALLTDVNVGSLLQTAMDNYEQIIATSLSAVSSVASVLTLTVTGFVISIYILANKKKLTCQFRKVLYAYVKRPIADKVVDVAALTNKTFSNFLSGQCVEALILGTMFFITMSILRLPFAPVISVFIAFTALIPYVGAFLGCVIGALLIVTVSPMKALIFIVTFLILQQLENQLIYPKVVGSSVGLSALWILVSVFVGGKLFGVVGMLFFIPLTSVCYSLIRLNVNSRLTKRGLTVDASTVTAAPPEGGKPEETPEASGK
ncbi:MAG: AI-2E family transporter [Candidatus Faecousia sp.]|nr:AI-2E family transporter [Bacillota bacterium]MDY4219024.1 AI-2E family transporter [Candidatus Faecousia sp.]